MMTAQMVLLVGLSLLAGPLKVAADSKPMQPVSVTRNSLVIAVDPRIELLAVVQYLSDYGKKFPGLVTAKPLAYRRDTDEWFAKVKSHPAIEMFSQLSSKSFSFDGPPQFVLCLYPDLSADRTLYDNAYVVAKAGGRESTRLFAKALVSFAAESQFSKFYNDHLAFYKQITAETAQKVEDKDVISELEGYFGEKRGSYTAVISPLLGGGCFGASVSREGKQEVYSVMGPWSDRDGIPEFGSPDAFHELQWHEFGHSFVNPMGEKHRALVQKRSALFAPMKPAMEKNAYGQWGTVVNESVLRAVTSRLSARLIDADAGEREVRQNAGLGFVFTSALVKKLEGYEQNREKFPTLESFYPELLTALDEFTPSLVKEAMESDSRDAIINEVTNAAKSVVYLVPDGEGSEYAVEFVKKIHERFFKTKELIDAAKLSGSELKEKLKGDFVLYTTIGSKLFNSATENLGIGISNGTLQWNGVSAPTAGVRMILVGRNPYGSGWCTVYAAGSNAVLDGINGVFHGPCSYHIFQGKKLLKEGYYSRRSVQGKSQQPSAEGKGSQ